MGRTRLPVPRGFKLVKNGIKNEWKCAFTEVKRNVLYHCTFQVRASKHFDPLSHTEHSTVPVSGGFQQYAPVDQMIDDLDTELHEALFDFVGKRNVSIAAICSDSFWRIMHLAYQAGKDGKKEITQISRYSFTNKFCTYAEKIRSNRLRELANCVYSCLAIDGGSNHMKPFLVVLVGNAYSGNHPIVYKLVPNFRGTSFDYQKIIENIITQLY